MRDKKNNLEAVKTQPPPPSNAVLADDLLKDLPADVQDVVNLMRQAWRIRRRPIREERPARYEQVG